MAFSERLAMLITANGAQAMAEFNKVGAAADRSLATTEQSAARFGAQMTRVGAGAVVFGAVVAAGLYKAAEAAGEQQAANLRLENTMANQPALAGASAQAFYDQASALQEVTRFGDEATVSAQSTLGAFGLTQDQILQLIPLVQDYAAKSGTDLVTAARNVGKATAGTNTTLKRAGVAFDEAAFSADAFGATIAALEGYAGGFAEQEGQTLAGQLEILKNRFGEIAEAVGGGAASAFSDLLAPVGALSDGLNSLDPSTQSLIGRIGTFGAVGTIAAGGLLVLAGQAIKLQGVLTALRNSAVVTRLSMMAMSTSAGQGLALLAPQITAVAVAAAASYIVLKDYVESVGEVGPSAEEATAATASFITSLAASGSASEALAVMVDNAVESGGALAEALTMSGTSAAEFASILESTPNQNYGSAIAEMAMRVEEAGGSYSEAQTALSDYAAELQDAAKGAIEAASASGDLPPYLRDSALAANTAEGGLTNYIGALARITAADPDAFAGLSESAASAEQAISDLEQEVQDYLTGIFAVPKAQRDLRESFADLVGVMWTQGSTADDLAAALEDVVTQTADLGVATGNMPAAIAVTLGSLREMRDSGAITAGRFRELKNQLLGLPGARATQVTAPGAGQALSQVDRLGGALLGLPPSRSPQVNAPGTPTALSQVDALGAALLGLPPNVRTPTTTPGLPAATTGVRNYRQAIDQIPPDVRTPTSAPGSETARAQLASVRDTANSVPRNVDVTVRVNTSQFYADINAAMAAAQQLESSAGRRMATDTTRPRVTASLTPPSMDGNAAPSSSSPPNIIIVSGLDQAMTLAGVRPDQRQRIRRRVAAGAV